MQKINWPHVFSRIPPTGAITRIGNQHPVARPLSTRAVPIHILKHSYPQGNIPCRTCPQAFA
ncbi:hypothetical protein HMPREF1980_01107 [Actinomyces sp. oral taxon 172 str. F0311]|nr:hypothetical protein HMPREF1980_01107 [Actinomyces sp. oral taxon 172 str. F0311]